VVRSNVYRTASHKSRAQLSFGVQLVPHRHLIEINGGTRWAV
jgi:hypothetical protein